MEAHREIYLTQGYISVIYIDQIIDPVLINNAITALEETQTFFFFFSFAISKLKCSLTAHLIVHCAQFIIF